MNLVANAIMLSNVADLTDLVVDMAEHGHQVTPKLVARLSPYTREHIRRFGRYILDMDDLQNLSPPRLYPSQLDYFSHVLSNIHPPGPAMTHAKATTTSILAQPHPRPKYAG